MTDPLTLLEALNRPGLLVQAARLALSGYNRGRHLRRPEAFSKAAHWMRRASANCSHRS